MLTPTELESLYTTKARSWSDERLRLEQSFIDARKAEGDETWAAPEVMAAWKKCVAAEVERRSLTA